MSKIGHSCWNGNGRLVAILATVLVAAGLAIIGGFRSQGTANATEHTAMRADVSDLRERMAAIETMVEVLKGVDAKVDKLLARETPIPAP